MQKQRVFLYAVFLAAIIAIGSPPGQALCGTPSASSLLPSDLLELEAQVAAAPTDAALRWRLLKAYFVQRGPAARTARVPHVIWVISNTPEVDLAGSPYVALHLRTEREAYEQARGLWLSHLEREPRNTRILLNAARFLSADDRALAKGLFERGLQLEPTNPEWKERLAMLHLREGPQGAPTAAAAQAVQLLEDALADTEGQQKRYHVLPQLAEAARRAGEDQKARNYAEELLALAVQLPQDWNYGNAIHEGNRVLGHVALRSGDIDSAKSFLLKAGDTPGSPQLNTFGPSLTLAAELLAKGERETVLQYLRSCSRFWRGSKSDALNRWIAEIEAGATPQLHRFRRRYPSTS